ncbi:hypothetical protein PGTUg99_008278 [Puccinia graminis f. sp. tritici]|uniref:Uncharacterized protein n=1 Tax=Puccinia graminis f. sp. tritici TaxID=56615 RepID=A0A5B0M2P5_PUCGR|nr:hypothetical protein PGTUg99_008278 [Puccinia graminis f. sp. tritici]
MLTLARSTGRRPCKKNLVTVGFEPTHLAIEDLKTAALDQLGQMTPRSFACRRGCNRHLDESACVTAAVGAVTAHETPNETPRCRSARERHAIVRGVTMGAPGKNEYMICRPPNDRPIVLAYHLLQLSAHLACPYSRHPLQNHPLACTAVISGQRRKERKQSS